MPDHQIPVILAALIKVAEDTTKQVALDVTANLIEDTPRDTSWARNNWIPNIGNKLRKPAGDPDNVAGANASLNASVIEVATTYRISRGSIFITSNVPYIQALNNGSSTQAPSGFVQIAIANALKRFKI